MSGRLASPVPVVIDALELGNLGSEQDARPVPPPYIPAWAEGDTPHYDSLDLNEYPVELLKLKKCRSFRADLRHKLEIIMRANGGYGRGGMWRAARELRITRITLWQWLNWHGVPTRIGMQRIDNLYVDALERLVAAKVRRIAKSRRAAEKRKKKKKACAGAPVT